MKKLLFSLLFVFFAVSAFSQNKDAILGKWINSTGEAHIDISKRNDRYYGKISWLKEPSTPEGNPKTDEKNPEASLRKKPVLGLEILKDFIYDGSKWTGGTIYDPKSGKTYSCNMTLRGNGDLSMRGYIGISLIGRSETWKRVR